jgi:hypothetical protein
VGGWHGPPPQSNGAGMANQMGGSPHPYGGAAAGMGAYPSHPAAPSAAAPGAGRPAPAPVQSNNGRRATAPGAPPQKKK